MERHSPRREGYQEGTSSRHHSHSDTSDTSRRLSRHSSKDRVLYKLPSLEEHDAEHQPTEDDAGRRDVDDIYESDSPIKLELSELRNSPSKISPKRGDDRYGVDRVVSRVDYTSDDIAGDNDGLPEDPWTPPV